MYLYIRFFSDTNIHLILIWIHSDIHWYFFDIRIFVCIIFWPHQRECPPGASSPRFILPLFWIHLFPAENAVYQPATIWRGGWNASDLRKCTLESLYYLLQPNNLHYEAVTHRFAKISPAPEIETTFTPFCSQPEDSVQYDISYMSTFKLCMVALPCHFWTEIWIRVY